jgi:hypothetical protein
VPIPPAQEPKFLATNTLDLVFPPFPGKQSKITNIPIEGMSAAVAAMRRLEK